MTKTAATAECPVSLEHTEGPNSYLAWHEWAEEMSKTHTQKKCVACGLYVIWVPKARSSKERAE